MSVTLARSIVPLTVVALTSRDRARTLIKAAFPRRHTRLTLARGSSDFERVFRDQLVDLAVVDLGAPNEETWRAVGLAREFPSIPFIGISPLRPSDTPAIARSVACDFADVIIESVDDAVFRDLLVPRAFSTRFSDALREPPLALGIETPLQRDSWRVLLGFAGRPVHTETIAGALGVTREHLSRAFATDGAPNLKRVIDLVRLIAAAELAKNPGYDVGDVARILGFASSSHLSTTSLRIVGTRPKSLARLRTIDLLERFTHGRMRSRPERRAADGGRSRETE